MESETNENYSSRNWREFTTTNQYNWVFIKFLFLELIIFLEFESIFWEKKPFFSMQNKSINIPIIDFL